MKNFSDLLDTDYSIGIELVIQPKHITPLAICINQVCLYQNTVSDLVIIKTQVAVLTPIEITVEHQGAYVSSLKFDDWQSRPQWGKESHGCWTFDTNGMPFYIWKHHATGQGWLLEPQM